MTPFFAYVVRFRDQVIVSAAVGNAEAAQSVKSRPKAPRARLHDQQFGIHLFMITAVVMLIGVSPTLMAAAIALILHTLIGAQITWTAFAINYVFGVLPPVLISALALKLVSELPQKNLFAYMLGVGFVGAIAARLVTSLLVYGLLSVSGNSALINMADNYLPWMLLISFPEGFVNGTIASSSAVFCPHWVRSFDEERYLGKDK